MSAMCPTSHTQTMLEAAPSCDSWPLKQPCERLRTFICEVDGLQLSHDRHAQLHLSSTHGPRPSSDHLELQPVVDAQALEQRQRHGAKHVDARVQLVVGDPS